MYMGYTNSIVETYETLIGKKQKYYVPNVKLSPEEIINLIDQSGGYTVLAHPNTVTSDKNILVGILNRLNDKEKELLTKLKKVSKFNPNNLVDIK